MWTFDQNNEIKCYFFVTSKEQGGGGRGVQDPPSWWRCGFPCLREPPTRPSPERSFVIISLIIGSIIIIIKISFIIISIAGALVVVTV